MVVAHELGHTLGAVQNKAPGSNDHGHCVDEWDVMCRATGPRARSRRLRQLVAGAGQPVRPAPGCGSDSYFIPKPKQGGYLATPGT